MSGTYKTRSTTPCECGHNRWKTLGDTGIEYSTKYQCRKCGAIRKVTKRDVEEEKRGEMAVHGKS